MNDDDEEFRRFVSARMDSLRGLAYLTCGDWQVAEDAVARTLAKLYVRWSNVETPYQYASRMVVRAAIDEVRRPWRRERVVRDPASELVEADPSGAVDERLRIQGALRHLPATQRAVLVLRFYEELSVEETAEALGRSVGTIKSQTSRGLAALRGLLAAAGARETDDEETLSHARRS